MTALPSLDLQAPVENPPTLIVSPPSTALRWHPLTRVAFRTAFCVWMIMGYGIASGLIARFGYWLYGLLHAGPARGNVAPWWVSTLAWPTGRWQWLWAGNNGNGFAPPGPEAKEGWQGMTTVIAGWFPKWLEGDPKPQARSGSGDQLYQWIQAGGCVAAALVIAALWNAIDWKRPAYPRLREFLSVWLRIVLGATMLGYGFAKVFPSQFSLPPVNTLLQTYGESSPMRLLWTFMGSSPAYTVFAGVAEAVAGILLLFRPTALLGSLIAAAVMTNVLAMNLCYDVPVKLYSGMYLLMAITIATPHVPRLLSAVIVRRERTPTAPRVRRWWLDRAWWTRWPLRIAGFAGAAWLIWVEAEQGWGGWQQVRKADSPKGGITGSWQVTSFQRDGVEVPALITDGTRWKRVLFTPFGLAGIRALNDVNQRFNLVIDETGHTITLTPTPGKSVGPKGETDERVIGNGKPPAVAGRPVNLEYSEPEPGTLVIEGEVDRADVKVTLTRLDRSSFLLMNRGFHWVSPMPFNR